ITNTGHPGSNGYDPVNGCYAGYPGNLIRVQSLGETRTPLLWRIYYDPLITYIHNKYKGYTSS
ncbi:65_t:CDS:1, partial [Ambispora leptoticha]